MISTLLLLVRMHFRTQVESRSAFVVDRLAQMLSYTAAFAVIWVLLNRFDTLGGWNWAEMALLLGFQLLTYSFGAAFSFVQFRQVQDYVRNGEFEAILVKPLSPWLYMTFSGLNVDYVGHVIIAGALIIWALSTSDVNWTPSYVMYLLGAIVSASVLVGTVLTAIGISALVIDQSSYLYGIFFGLSEMVRYPVSIYPPTLQWALVTIVPFGFLNYVPASVLLDRDVLVLGAWAPAATLLSGPVVLVSGMAFWKWCLRRYQGLS